MEIKLKNDGKQRAQSCEAEIELCSKNRGGGTLELSFLVLVQMSGQLK